MRKVSRRGHEFVRMVRGYKQRQAGGMTRAAPHETVAGQSSTAAALYIGTLTEELARIARHHRFDGLAYILEMARMEADQIGKSSADGEAVS
jgi:hypothetical protein